MKKGKMAGAGPDVVKWWVSCPKFTVQVNTDLDGVILDAAPIVTGFTGQSLLDLVGWAERKWPGKVETEEIQQ